MTPTERAKRSDALYYETVSVNRRVLCDMVANREADLEDARALNEHMGLKYMAAMGELGEENDQLKAESDKLRELARHMRTCMEHYEMDGTINCDRCPLDNDVGNCDFEQRMRELGVDDA